MNKGISMRPRALPSHIVSLRACLSLRARCMQHAGEMGKAHTPDASRNLVSCDWLETVPSSMVVIVCVCEQSECAVLCLVKTTRGAHAGCMHLSWELSLLCCSCVKHSRVDGACLTYRVASHSWVVLVPSSTICVCAQELKYVYRSK